MDDKYNILKNGLYSLREAATYARLHYNTLHRWIELSELKVIEEGNFISFLDFIQALAIREIRRQYNISLKKIKDAVETAKKSYDIEYPFAREHTTYLFGKEIYIQLNEVEDPIQISGKNKDQIAFKKIIELYMKDLSFGSNGWADKYKPYNGILMDPHFRFGEPIVESVKIPAIVLWEALQTEGSIEAAAEAYGVTSQDIYIASKYIDTLDLKAA